MPTNQPAPPGPGRAEEETHLQDLLERIHQGDQAARDELFALTRDRLKRLVSRKLHTLFGRLREREESSDVVQDLFVELLQRWDRFLTFHDRQQQVDIPLTTARQYYLQAAGWGRLILVDLCRKHFGRQGNRPHLVPLHPASDEHGLPSPRPDHEPGTNTDDPAQLQAFTELHEAIGNLPAELREVAELRYYQEMSHAHIARILGIAEITSKVRWAKARAALEAAFQGSPFAWAEFVRGDPTDE